MSLLKEEKKGLRSAFLFEGRVKYEIASGTLGTKTSAQSILVWYCIRKEIGTLHFSSKHLGPHLSLEHICLPVQMKKQYSMGMGWIMLRMSLKHAHWTLHKYMHGLSMAVILIIIIHDSKYT